MEVKNIDFLKSESLQGGCKLRGDTRNRE